MEWLGREAQKRLERTHHKHELVMGPKLMREPK